MQFTIKRSVFLDRIKEALVFSSNRSTVECYTGILLEASPRGEILLKATDGSACAVISVDAELSGNDTALISGRRTAAMLSAMTGDNVTVHSGNDEEPVEVRDGTTLFKIPRMNREDFPEIEIDKPECYAVTTCEDIKSAIKSTSWSICKDETRPNMCGLRFSCAGDKAQIVSTDGYTASCHVLADIYSERSRGFTLSEKYARMLCSLLKDGACSIYSDGTHAIFSSDSFGVRVPVMNDRFPDTSRILAVTGDNVVNIPRSDIIPLLERAMIVSEDNGHSCSGLKISLSRNKIETVVKSTYGKVSETYTTEYGGENVSILVNPRYIYNAVSSCSDENIEIRVSRSNAPIRISDSGNVMIVSVMRL